MFCGHCGKEVKETDNWCPYCGANLSEQREANEEGTTQEVVKGETANETLKVADVKVQGVDSGENKSEDQKTIAQETCTGTGELDWYRPKIEKETLKILNFWKILLLSIVTCGIYGFYTLHCFAKDMNVLCKGDGKKSPNFIKVFLLSIITCGVYGCYWQYMQGQRLYEASEGYGVKIEEKGSTVLFWLTIGVVFLGLGPLIAFYILIRNRNKLAEQYNAGKVNASLYNIKKERMGLLVKLLCVLGFVQFVVALAGVSIFLILFSASSKEKKIFGQLVDFTTVERTAFNYRFNYNDKWALSYPFLNENGGVSIYNNEVTDFIAKVLDDNSLYNDRSFFYDFDENRITVYTDNKFSFGDVRSITYYRNTGKYVVGIEVDFGTKLYAASDELEEKLNAFGFPDITSRAIESFYNDLKEHDIVKNEVESLNSETISRNLQARSDIEAVYVRLPGKIDFEDISYSIDYEGGMVKCFDEYQIFMPLDWSSIEITEEDRKDGICFAMSDPENMGMIIGGRYDVQENSDAAQILEKLNTGKVDYYINEIPTISFEDYEKDVSGFYFPVRDNILGYFMVSPASSEEDFNIFYCMQFSLCKSDEILENDLEHVSMYDLVKIN